MEQEDYCALGPGSDGDCQITVWAGGALCFSLCFLGHPSPWVKSWGQPLGLPQRLSPVKEKEKCLYPQGSGRCCDVLAPVAEQLLFCCHLFGAQHPALLPISWHGLPVLPALGMRHTAAGAVVVSFQMQNDGQTQA